MTDISPTLDCTSLSAAYSLVVHWGTPPVVPLKN
jgi:hypothetical protein